MMEDFELLEQGVHLDFDIFYTPQKGIYYPPHNKEFDQQSDWQKYIFSICPYDEFRAQSIKGPTITLYKGNEKFLLTCRAKNIKNREFRRKYVSQESDNVLENKIMRLEVKRKEVLESLERNTSFFLMLPAVDDLFLILTIMCTQPTPDEVYIEIQKDFKSALVRMK